MSLSNLSLNIKQIKKINEINNNKIKRTLTVCYKKTVTSQDNGSSWNVSIKHFEKNFSANKGQNPPSKEIENNVAVVRS